MFYNQCGKHWEEFSHVDEASGEHSICSPSDLKPPELLWSSGLLAQLSCYSYAKPNSLFL